MCKWLCLVEFSPVEQKHLKKQSLLRSPTAGVKWNQSYTRLETIKTTTISPKKGPIQIKDWLAYQDVYQKRMDNEEQLKHRRLIK